MTVTSRQEAIDLAANYACKYLSDKGVFEKAKDSFEATKKRFYEEMENFFESEQIDKSITFENETFDGDLKVTKLQKVSVEFDAEKLERAIGKDFAKSVITKQYEIMDIDGLIAYLKECGVDPNVFKSFLNVTKSVDTKELDKLEELGKITAEQIEGCYSVKSSSPYFTVSVKRGQGNGDTKW